jgi:hypothetical protein
MDQFLQLARRNYQFGDMAEMTKAPFTHRVGAPAVAVFDWEFFSKSLGADPAVLRTVFDRNGKP